MPSGTGGSYQPLARRLALSFICVAGSVPVHAQMVSGSLATSAEANSVTARASSNFDSSGIPLGPFRLDGSADIDVAYDNNVYNTNAQRLSDVIATITPRVQAETVTPGHDLVLAAQGVIQRFGKLDAENNEQYNLTADGRLSIGRPFTISGSAFYGRHSELRGTLGDIVVGAPNQYQLGGATATATAQLVNLVVSIGGGFASFNYRPVALAGSTISQDYRDRTVYTGEARAELQVGPGIQAFTTLNGNWQDYKFLVPANQNSHGYAAIGGVDFGITELISGEIGVGYLSQTYDQGAIHTVGGVTYSGKIVWNLTTLLTVTLSGGRTLQQSPYFDQAGVVEDSFGVHLDYELLRNLIITFDENGTFDNFRGLARHDRLFATAVAARYRINRTFEASLRFNNRDQASRGPAARPYSGDSLSLSVMARL